MGKFYERIEPDLASWILDQKMFFVSTAPLDPSGMVNASPKGYDSFRIVDPNQVCYLDLTGSGIETISNLRENGRITFLFMAFKGGPRVLRLFGRGRTLLVNTPEYEEYYNKHFRGSKSTDQEEAGPGAEPYILEGATQIRGIIVADIYKVGTSCGWGVPYYEYVGDRPTLKSFWSKRTQEELAGYWAMANTTSLNGLEGMRLKIMGPEWAPKSRSSIFGKSFSGTWNASALVLVGFSVGVTIGVFLRKH